MKQRIILISNLLSGLLILNQFGFWDTLVLFILVGKLPGINYSLSPTAMLFIFTVLGIGLLAAVVMRSGRRVTPPLPLPKRRYSRS